MNRNAFIVAFILYATPAVAQLVTPSDWPVIVSTVTQGEGGTIRVPVFIVPPPPPEPRYLTFAKSVYVAGAVMDWTSTNIALRHGYGEGNPFLQHLQDKPTTVGIVTASIAVVNYFIWREVGKSNPKLATVGFLGIGILQGSMGAHNIKLMAEHGDQR